MSAPTIRVRVQPEDFDVEEELENPPVTDPFFELEIEDQGDSGQEKTPGEPGV